MTEDAYANLRRQLLEVVRRRGGAADPAVQEALLAVPRHAFLPDWAPESVYQDDAIVTRRDADGLPTSSSSQPTIMAIMLDQLALRPGHRVLEIGAGTGYNAALMAHIVGPTGVVVSIDIDADTVAGAVRGLAAAGHPEVTVVCADGADGYLPAAPYDRIIATVGVWDLAPAWLDQLGPDGRIVVPLDLRGSQVAVALVRRDDHLASDSLVRCGFMRLRGSLAGPEQPVSLDPATGLRLTLPQARPVDAARLRAALDQTPQVRLTTVGLSDGRTMALWLGIADPRAVGLADEGGGIAALEPALSHEYGFRYTSGLLDGDSVALVARPPDDPHHPLQAHGYGPRGAALADDLAAALSEWDGLGQPDAEQMHLRIYTDDRSLDGVVVEKRFTRVVVDFSPAASA
jgi:protein-L-isoaspartate(D-aspartate) O-methyltransferase